MTEALQEDENYLISTAVDGDMVPDDTDLGDASDVAEEDQTAETQLIQEIRKYLAEAKAEHNSFDIIDLTEAAKMTPTQQIAVHKCVVQHLRNIESTINNKVKEN